MTLLIDEIKRSPSVASGTCADARMDRLCCGRNGIVSLSGALILFADGASSSPIYARWHEDVWPARQVYSTIEHADHIVGCDVTGDLLVLRNEKVVRLDGETGEIVVLATSIEAFLGMDLSVASETLGGLLARDRLSGLVLGSDPMRLLPSFPFVIGDRPSGTFDEVPLSIALKAKAHLHGAIENLSDGEIVELDFWPSS